MKTTKFILITFLIISIISCKKRTQDFDFSPQFLKKKLWYSVTLSDGTKYNEDGVLTFEPKIMQNNSYGDYEVYYRCNDHSQNNAYFLHYFLPLPSEMFFTKGGFYIRENCSSGFFGLEKRFLFLPTLLQKDVNTYVVNGCNEKNRTITIINPSSHINTAIGSQEVITAYIEEEGKSNGNLYYYNHILGFVKIIKDYNQNTGKGSETFELVKIE